MPRQRTYYSRRTHVFPDDFPQRLERFKVESALSWAEIARLLGTYPLTIRRWRYKGVRPNLAHQGELLDLADDLGLGHIFTEWSVQRETRHDVPGPAGSACRSERALRPNAPTRCKSPGGDRHVDDAATARGCNSKPRTHGRTSGLKRKKAAYMAVQEEAVAIATTSPCYCGQRPAPTGSSPWTRPSEQPQRLGLLLLRLSLGGRSLRRPLLTPGPSPGRGSGSDGERGAWVRLPTWPSPSRSPPRPPAPVRPGRGCRRSRCAGPTRAAAPRWWPGPP